MGQGHKGVRAERAIASKTGSAKMFNNLIVEFTDNLSFHIRGQYEKNKNDLFFCSSEFSVTSHEDFGCFQQLFAPKLFITVNSLATTIFFLENH